MNKIFLAVALMVSFTGELKAEQGCDPRLIPRVQVPEKTTLDRFDNSYYGYLSFTDEVKLKPKCEQHGATKRCGFFSKANADIKYKEIKKGQLTCQFFQPSQTLETIDAKINAGGCWSYVLNGKGFELVNGTKKLFIDCGSTAHMNNNRYDDVAASELKQQLSDLGVNIQSLSIGLKPQAEKVHKGYGAPTVDQGAAYTH